MNTTTKFLLSAALTASLLAGCKKVEVIPEKVSIQGKVACNKDPNQGMIDVKVDILKDGVTLQSINTNAKGEYTFQNLEKGSNYAIQLSKVGIFTGNTLQLALLSKKITGLPTTASAFQLLAADIDFSGKIDAEDITTLRKYVLGLANELNVWRFATNDYEFPSPTNLLGAGSVNTLIISNLDGNKTNVDFVPVKVGDTDLKETCK